MIPIHPLFDSFESIGRGSSAMVYKSIYLPTNITVALKSMFETNDPEVNRCIQREIDLHRSLDHPFITSFFGEYRSYQQRVMVLEYVEGQTLLEEVNSIGGIDETNAHRIFCQIVSAVKYLHTEKKIAHRDLKLENIMIDFQGNAKLIDFGFSKININALTTQCASIPYAAPEIFKNEEYTIAVDIWSLGVVLFGMLAGTLPFGDSDFISIAKSVLCDPPYYDISLVPESVRGLIRGMLEPDPNKRLTIQQVEMHEWVQQNPICNVIKPEFYQKAELLTYPPNQILDSNVLKIMKDYSIDYSSIDPESLEKDSSDSLMGYKMIKRSIMHSKFDSAYSKTLSIRKKEHFNVSKLPLLNFPCKVNSAQNNDKVSAEQYDSAKLNLPTSFTMKTISKPKFINIPLRKSNITHNLGPKPPKLFTSSKVLTNPMDSKTSRPLHTYSTLRSQKV